MNKVMATTKIKIALTENDAQSLKQIYGPLLSMDDIVSEIIRNDIVNHSKMENYHNLLDASKNSMLSMLTDLNKVKELDTYKFVKSEVVNEPAPESTVTIKRKKLEKNTITKEDQKQGVNLLNTPGAKLDVASEKTLKDMRKDAHKRRQPQHPRVADGGLL